MPPVATGSDVFPLIGTPLPNGNQPNTPRTYKASKAKHVNLLTQALKIGHQKVNIDVDLSKNLISGATEITVLPTSSHLRSIKLDCREMTIKDILVNNRQVNFVHNDMLYINDPDMFEDFVELKAYNVLDIYNENLTIHQHHLIRQKLNYIFGEINEDQSNSSINHGNTEELTIFFPDNLKLHLTDINSVNTPGSNPNTATPMHLKSRNTYNDFYTPVQVKIEYELLNPKNGVNFVTDLNQSPNDTWHAYTTNSTYNISTSSWVPCIDNLWDRNTWTVEINIPRTVKDIGHPIIIGTKEAIESRKMEYKRRRRQERNSRKSGSKINGDVSSGDEGNDNNDDDYDEEDDDDDEIPQNLIVATGDYVETKEVPHPTDLSKKTVLWTIFNPVCAHHVGWAVGCFENVDLPDEEEDIDEEAEDILKEMSCPIKLYCLPGKAEMTKNTCIFMRKAITYFLKEFGSFPFNCFSLIFVHGSNVAANNFAGLSILDDSILYPANILEPIYQSTETVVECIATQWSGINIVPQVFNDMWCTIGIARFMTFQYLRVLMGNNEMRFRIKKYMDEVVRTDIGKTPLALNNFRYPISENDLQFMKLKSPLVLFILDKRMIKTDKSFGLSRVLPKLFLQAMSGELVNNTLSTQHFQYVCEKVNRNRLENFFKQWLFGSGTPIFFVSQRFNRKRGMIEVVVRQQQGQERHSLRQLFQDPNSFINTSINLLDNEKPITVQNTFLGPMTIRVHEADGIPYEHVVDLKDNVVKIDINYNSKFRRMKKHKEDAAEGGTYSRFGDIIQSEQELAEWGLEDWGPIDDEELYNNAFEWIRVDTDFEWIAKSFVRQPDYMYVSQLQYDRDVEAQYEAVNFFGSLDKPTLPYCTSLIRTIMDERYFYGVRIAAAEALARFSHQGNNYIGMPFLIKAYKKLFCFPNSTIPLANDFSNITKFLMLKEFPRIFCHIRDDKGNVPYELRDIILNLVIYNENSNNIFQDSLYVASLIESLTTSIINSNATPVNNLMIPPEKPDEELDPKDKEFVDVVVSEIDRQQKLDNYVPSYHRVLSLTCLKQKIRLARFGVMELLMEELLNYTSNKNVNEFRLMAFYGLLILGGLKNSYCLNYFLKCCLFEYKDQTFRSKLIDLLVKAIVVAATQGTTSVADDPEFKTLENYFGDDQPSSSETNLIIFDGNVNTRRDQMARASIKGTIQILRRDYSVGKGLRFVFWELIHSSLLSIYDKRRLFSICQILYKEIDSFIVDFPVPCVPLNELNKKLVLKHLGEGKILVHREGRFKIQLATKLTLNKKNKSDEKTKLKLKINAPEEVPAMRAPVMRAPVMRAPKVTVPKATAAKSAVAEPPVVEIDPLVTRPNKRTVKFKLNKSKLQKLTRTNNDPANGVKLQGTTVTIPLSQEVYPLRYVKMLLKDSKVKVSRVPFEKIPGVSFDNMEIDNLENTEQVVSSVSNEQADAEQTEQADHEKAEQVKRTNHEKSEQADPEQPDSEQPDPEQADPHSEPAKPTPAPKLKLKLNLKS